MQDRGVAAALLFHPMNVRYVSYPGVGTVGSAWITFRAALVPAVGKMILWDYTGEWNPVDESDKQVELVAGSRELQHIPDFFTGKLRPMHGLTFFPQGSTAPDSVRAFASQIADVLDEWGLNGERLAIDRADMTVFTALQARGIEICDAQEALERARSVKTVDELAMLRQNARTAALAIDAMRERLVPGVTENELWATMMGTAMANGAEWVNTRLLSSGQRTNPWAQEATDKVVEAGELVALDTDLAGPWGYFTDVSRTYLCGDVAPTDQQRRLYQGAVEFVSGNIELMRVGASWAELGESIKRRMPKEYYERRYPMIGHGVGVSDEYPCIWWDDHQDGEIEAGMCFSLESYFGKMGGTEGVKFEEQIIVTEDGPELISGCVGYDERLLA
jgi:Xaa-Pro aminopeptidase